MTVAEFIGIWRATDANGTRYDLSIRLDAPSRYSIIGKETPSGQVQDEWSGSAQIKLIEGDYHICIGSISLRVLYRASDRISMTCVDSDGNRFDFTLIK